MADVLKGIQQVHKWEILLKWTCWFCKQIFGIAKWEIMIKLKIPRGREWEIIWYHMIQQDTQIVDNLKTKEFFNPKWLIRISEIIQKLQ